VGGKAPRKKLAGRSWPFFISVADFCISAADFCLSAGDGCPLYASHVGQPSPLPPAHPLPQGSTSSLTKSPHQEMRYTHAPSNPSRHSSPPSPPHQALHPLLCTTIPWHAVRVLPLPDGTVTVDTSSLAFGLIESCRGEGGGRLVAQARWAERGDFFLTTAAVLIEG
jgi:hypothetical protein